jgi:DNA polymerase-3 subunit epsilon
MDIGPFVALDVETANADLASICQIGVVCFSDGIVESSWTSLVNPEDDFDPVNVSIHGINQESVRDAPRFVEVAPTLINLLSNKTVATHMAFDRVALTRVSEKYGLSAPNCQWIDTARVARRAWVQLSSRGYGLAKLAEHCGIEFRHHDALEDARAAGQILVQASIASSLSIEQWVVRANRPIDFQGSAHSRSGNPDGELFGEEVVFTGALSMPRREAADLAALAGCEVAGSVGKTTTLLIVGDQDIRKLVGHEKSSKHRKAEELIARGQVIRILAERDFRTLLGRLDGPQRRTVDRKAPGHKSARPPERSLAPISVPTGHVDRNLLGIKLEAEGLVDNAVECYEANVRDGFDGDHPYRRLAVIYRRRGELDKERLVPWIGDS